MSEFANGKLEKVAERRLNPKFDPMAAKVSKYKKNYEDNFIGHTICRWTNLNKLNKRQKYALNKKPDSNDIGGPLRTITGVGTNYLFNFRFFFKFQFRCFGTFQQSHMACSDRRGSVHCLLPISPESLQILEALLQLQRL